MLEPVTSLVFLGSAAINGVLGNHSDRRFTARWEQFKHNLAQHRPYANDELRRTVYRAYLMATLQSCAALLERKNLKIEAWFKFGTLPGRMADAFRSLVREAPVGVFTEAAKQWLEDVSRNYTEKLKRLDSDELDAPFEYGHEEFAALMREIEVLMQPETASEREQAIRAALSARVLNDLENEFGSPPREFASLVNERWFEFLCASFQFYTKRNQEIANVFQTGLLAELLSRNKWQSELTDLGGESLKRIEAAQTWLIKEQREGFEQITALMTQLLPLLSFVSEAARNGTLVAFIHAESERVIYAVKEESEKSRAHAAEHFNQLEAKMADGLLRADIINSPREATLLIREAIFAMDVRTWPNNVEDTNLVLKAVARGLAQPFLLSRDIAEKSLADARAIAKSIADARSMAKSIVRWPDIGDILVGYKDVRRILQPILKQLPSEEDYLSALQRIAPNLRGSLLEAEYNLPHDDRVAFICLLLLRDLGERDTLLKLLKQRLLTIPPDPQLEAYCATKWLAEKFLRDEFPLWWEKEIGGGS